MTRMSIPRACAADVNGTRSSAWPAAPGSPSAKGLDTSSWRTALPMVSPKGGLPVIRTCSLKCRSIEVASPARYVSPSRRSVVELHARYYSGVWGDEGLSFGLGLPLLALLRPARLGMLRIDPMHEVMHSKYADQMEATIEGIRSAAEPHAHPRRSRGSYGSRSRSQVATTSPQRPTKSWVVRQAVSCLAQNVVDSDVQRAVERPPAVALVCNPWRSTPAKTVATAGLVERPVMADFHRRRNAEVSCEAAARRVRGLVPPREATRTQTESVAHSAGRAMPMMPEFPSARFAFGVFAFAAFQAGASTSVTAQNMLYSTSPAVAVSRDVEATLRDTALRTSVGLPQQGPIPHCRDWNTQAFFEKATPSSVDACLDGGAEVTASDDEKNTPLHWAARVSNDPHVIHVLLSAATDVLRRAPRSPRRNRWRRHAPARRYSLPYRPLRKRNRAGYTPTQLAVQHNKNLAILDTLLRAGADPNQQTADGRTLLHLAAQGNPDPKVFTRLLSAGVDPAATNSEGHTATYLAVQHGSNSAVLDTLVRAEASDIIFDLKPFRDGNRFVLGSLYDRRPIIPNISECHPAAEKCRALLTGRIAEAEREAEEYAKREEMEGLEPIFEAQLGGDVPIWGQDGVRHAALAVAAERNNHTQWAAQVYFAMMIRLRMLHGPSNPVPPPSFVPKTTLQLLGFHSVGRARNRTSMTAIDLTFGHHSNGQTDCPFLEQAADDDDNCIPLFADDISGAEINRVSGNFSTHYFQSRVHHQLRGRSIPWQAIFGGGFEHHLTTENGSRGSLRRDLAERYGRTRIWGSAEGGYKGVHFRGWAGWIIHGSVVRRKWMGGLEVLVYVKSNPDIGAYIRTSGGQDMYNINFESEVGGSVDVGLVFNWGNVFSRSLPSLF